MEWHYSYAAILIAVPSYKERIGANDASHLESVEIDSQQGGKDGDNKKMESDNEDE